MKTIVMFVLLFAAALAASAQSYEPKWGLQYDCYYWNYAGPEVSSVLPGRPPCDRPVSSTHLQQPFQSVTGDGSPITLSRGLRRASR
ncbi:MAG TPA: hypothetical protein VLX28_07485, partial [Thermoanaerobaculia bacterium]|nr:hypothetical protein [Thermoanaerobaculia bacterium]